MASRRVRHRWRSSNSICTLDQKLSIIALSLASPTEPKEGSKPDSRIRSVKDHEVKGTLRPAWTMPPPLDPPSLDRQVKGVHDHVRVLGGVDRPADNAPDARASHNSRRPLFRA